jgi:hypothetical protein
LESEGFEGFVSVGRLVEHFFERSAGGKADAPVDVSGKRGVYMMLHLDDARPEMVLAGKNGFMGGRPSATINYLNQKWVDDTIVVYIGQAGGGSSTVVLRHGLTGRGGHSGGRLVWHLLDPTKLVLCWKPIAEADPELVESTLLGEFEECYMQLPFANIIRGKTFV